MPWPVPWSNRGRPATAPGGRRHRSARRSCQPGNTARGDRDVALEHAREAVAHLVVGSPIATVRVMSVVPSGYCPPESTRYSVPSSSARGRRCHAVMDDRAVGAGASDGREDTTLSCRCRGGRFQRLGAPTRSTARGRLRSNQARKRAIAAPSRRAPAGAPRLDRIFPAFRATGSLPRDLAAGRGHRSRSAAAAVAGSSRTLRFAGPSAARPPANSAGSRSRSLFERGAHRYWRAWCPRHRVSAGRSAARSRRPAPPACGRGPRRGC